MRTTAAVTTTTFRSELSPEPGSAAGLASVALRSLCLLAALFLLVQCRCEGQEETSALSVAASASPAAEPPATLLALVYLEPHAAWGALRPLALDQSKALPMNPEVALVQALDLPIGAAQAFDLQTPVRGALLSSQPDELGLALGFQVRSGRELIAQLTTGKQPAFRVKSVGEGVTRLVREAPAKVTLSIYRNTLVAAGSRPPAAQLVRFLAARQPATRPPGGWLVVTAGAEQLQGSLSRWLRARWQSYRDELSASQRRARVQHGRDPDFGDPGALLMGLSSVVDDVLSWLESSRRLTLTLGRVGAECSLSAELEPTPEGPAARAIADLSVGSAAPLGRLPSAAALGLLVRGTESGRRRLASRLSAGLERILAERLGAADRNALEQALTAFAEGRGDTMVAGLIPGDVPAVVVQTDTRDAVKLESALSSIPKLLRISAIADPLENWLGRPVIRPVRRQLADAPVAGYRVTFAKRQPTTALELVWRVSPAGFQLVASEPQATSLLLALFGSPTRFGELPEAQAALSAVDSASWVLVARPALLGLLAAQTSGSRSVAVLEVGRRQQSGFIKLNVPEAVLLGGIQAAVQ